MLKSRTTVFAENHVTMLLGPRQLEMIAYDIENPADRSGLANPLTDKLAVFESQVRVDHVRGYSKAGFNLTFFDQILIIVWN